MLNFTDDEHNDENTGTGCSQATSTPKQSTNPPAKRYHCGFGYSTLQGRKDWLKAHDITDESAVSQSVEADRNPTAPLYFWQLYSLLGPVRIKRLIETFYESVYDDEAASWFRDAFSRISGVEHHVHTQAAFWIDAFGGGRAYHGGDVRLNFHHQYNANDVMNARGASRWMYHMRQALQEHRSDFDRLDRRILPCVVDFLITKMRKYACDHDWNFKLSDFDGILDKSLTNDTSP